MGKFNFQQWQNEICRRQQQQRNCDERHDNGLNAMRELNRDGIRHSDRCRGQLIGQTFCQENKLQFSGVVVADIVVYAEKSNWFETKLRCSQTDAPPVVCYYSCSFSSLDRTMLHGIGIHCCPLSQWPFIPRKMRARTHTPLPLCFSSTDANKSRKQFTVVNVYQSVISFTRFSKTTAEHFSYIFFLFFLLLLLRLVLPVPSSSAQLWTSHEFHQI